MTAPADRPDTGMDGVVARLTRLCALSGRSGAFARGLLKTDANQLRADLAALIASHQERGRALESVGRLVAERLALIPEDLVRGGVLGELLLDIQSRSALTHTKE